MFTPYNSSIQASIIIPTYNRALYLQSCLEALAALETDQQTIEILVVDNNSTDNTKDIFRKFSEAHSTINIRYLRETQQGVSYTRNRGVQEACGEIVCFLDDDSPPVPEWLKFLLEPFNDPKVGCTGGPSVLDFQGQEIPSWLCGDLQGLLSGYALPFSEPTQVTKWEHYPLSCNMAIRQSLFTDLGLFRADLDRSGRQVLAAGDTEMADRITKAGWKVIYVPNAPVRHIVAPERLDKKHIYRIGRGLAESHIILTSDPRPQKILRWFASDIWYAVRRFFWLIVAIVRRKQLWYDDYMRFWMVAQRVPSRIRRIIQN